MVGWLKPRDALFFPYLTHSTSKVTSEQTSNYNCIAWAAGQNTQWWEPHEDAWWPEEAPRTYEIASLKAAYATIGFEECQDGSLEEGIEKIALYAQGECYTHAARQLPNGRWTSKMGQNHDIEHDAVKTVEGGAYGKCVAYMARSIQK